MPQRRLLIDLENVPTSDYNLLPEDFFVTVFLGNKQHCVSIGLFDAAISWGKRLDVKKIPHTGKDALDIVLAFHIGCLSMHFPNDEYFILSKDKGYEPIVELLNQKSVFCRRIETLCEIFTEGNALNIQEQTTLDMLCIPQYTDPHEYARGKLKPMVGRPKTAKTLRNHINAMFRQSIVGDTRENVLSRLYTDKIVVEKDGKLIYCFPTEEKP